MAGHKHILARSWFVSDRSPRPWDAVDDTVADIAHYSYRLWPSTPWFGIDFVGCHLFSVSQSGEGELKLAVAVGKKVILLRWKHSVVWSTWSLGNNRNLAEGFDTIKVAVLSSLIPLVFDHLLEETSKSLRNWVVAYRKLDCVKHLILRSDQGPAVFLISF